ncbi:MAG: hypothetical protein ACERKD_17250 [Prolixibacteraceae bacterium]
MKLKQIIFAFLLSILFFSCQFEESDIAYNLGNDFINDPTTVIMIDTMTVNTFTTTVDSFTTSRSSRFLVGSTTNSYGITTYCESYLCFELNDAGVFHETARFDSICLLLNRDGYNSGDTSSVGEFEVYTLTEEIEADETSGYLYNTSYFASEDTPAAKFNIDYSSKERLISVRLDDAFGENLFQLTKDESELMTDKELFQAYFKGMVIKPVDGMANFVAGLNGRVDSMDAPRIRIYYSDITVTDDLSFDFPLEKYDTYDASSNSTTVNFRSFNHIENHFEGTILQEIESGEAKLSSKLTNNVSFIQFGSFLQTRIEIPGIDNLYSLGIGSIIKAELHIEPIEESFSEKADLPSSLIMSLVDAKNRYYRGLYVAGTTDNAYGYLNYDKEFKGETSFSYDITNYVKTEYEDKGDPIYSLMLTAPYDPDYPTVDQLIIGNGQNVKNKMKLKVYLSNY